MEPKLEYFNLQQNVYYIDSATNEHRLICIALSKGVAEIIVAKFNGTPIVELGSIPDEKLHSNN